MFFSCVLDSSFHHLETSVRLPNRCEPDSRLVTSLAKRCPRLSSLLMNFGSQHASYPMCYEVMPVIQSLSSLSHLSCLHLYFAPEDLCTLLRVISQSCPFLSELWIDTFPLFADKSHVLALILGKLLDDDGLKEKEAIWSADEVLQSLSVPPDCVTAYCSTLRHVNLGSRCRPASLAFLLRHMPLLETVDDAWENLSKGVLLFQDAPDLKGTDTQNQFDELCRGAASRRPLDNPISNNIIPLSSSGNLIN